MGVCFFDTSAFVKRYHKELGHIAVEEEFLSGNECWISHLGLLECHSAFATKVRTKALSPEAARVSLDQLMTDFEERLFQVLSMTPRHYVVAQGLLTRYGQTHALKTLDAIHLAVAIHFGQRRKLDKFLTCDRVLARVAALEGLRVVNPAQPE